MCQPTVIMHAVSKRFGLHPVLKCIDLALRPGSLTGLVGPNGVGKTTLMRLMAGLIGPDHGSVTICGREANCATGDCDGFVGFVPENPSLLEHLTPHELIALKGTLIGVGRNQLKTAIPNILAAWDLSRHEHTWVKGLSHGMKQKLTILLALLGTPDVLLLDEPFVGLDIVSASVLKAVLKLQASAGMTVLISSHALPLIGDICQRMVILSGGTAVYDGPARPPEDGSRLDDFVLSHFGALNDPFTVAQKIITTLPQVP